MSTPAYAAAHANARLTPFSIERRRPGARDVAIDIRYCGVCHSDVHQGRDEWRTGIFPMVPGHEIVGTVSAVGAEVKGFAAGDTVGVGCFIDSCRHCDACEDGEEQFCSHGMVGTYNSRQRDGSPTYGGYSTHIVVDENYLLRVPDSIPMERAAPLLCAGITTYSPLRRFEVKPGDKVAVVGLGGLGHMGVKIAAAMGAHVTVLSTSPGKHDDALRLGAEAFFATRDPHTFKTLAGSFDLILDSVAAAHDYNVYLGLLKRGGIMVLVGMPDKPVPLAAGALIMGRKRLAGSLIGGIRETQEMLDFCAAHDLAADIELIRIEQINEAWERMIKGDVRYRFVIDCGSF